MNLARDLGLTDDDGLNVGHYYDKLYDPTNISFDDDADFNEFRSEGDLPVLLPGSDLLKTPYLALKAVYDRVPDSASYGDLTSFEYLS